MKSADKFAFDEFIFRFDDSITTDVAAKLAEQIGVEFDPLDYDH